MAVTSKDVEHMAELARLKLDEESKERFTRQFSDILHYMDILNSVDVSGVAPLYHPLDPGGTLRADKAENTRTTAEIMANAPREENNYFVVPRIV